MIALAQWRTEAEEALRLAKNGHGRQREAQRLIELIDAIDSGYLALGTSQEREALSWIEGRASAFTQTTCHGNSFTLIHSKARSGLQ